jgi:hypothetical protein
MKKKRHTIYRSVAVVKIVLGKTLRFGVVTRAYHQEIIAALRNILF